MYLLICYIYIFAETNLIEENEELQQDIKTTRAPQIDYYTIVW